MATAGVCLSRCSIRLLIFLCIGLAGAGCGPGFKVVPVAGKITVDGKPLTDADATVLFRPNVAKGNTVPVEFAGVADEDGNYTLYYGDGNPGAAPGWYKVAVVATEPLVPRGSPKNRPRVRLPGPRSAIKPSLIDTRYNIADNSGIEIEVVENPAGGAYDLSLTGAAKK
jgi:hypothetical protein